MLGQRIATIQNLAYLKKLTQDIRDAIKEDRYLDFYNDFCKNSNYKD